MTLLQANVPTVARIVRTHVSELNMENAHLRIEVRELRDELSHLREEHGHGE